MGSWEEWIRAHDKVDESIVDDTTSSHLRDVPYLYLST
jgi:hypothetical protein